MPQRLTYDEVEMIGGMVQSAEHRHLSTRGLALHAQRVGKVFAHSATWGKLAAGALDPMNTRAVLITAAGTLVASAKANVFMDSGPSSIGGYSSTNSTTSRP